MRKGHWREDIYIISRQDIKITSTDWTDRWVFFLHSDILYKPLSQWLLLFSLLCSTEVTSESRAPWPTPGECPSTAWPSGSPLSSRSEIKQMKYNFKIQLTAVLVYSFIFCSVRDVRAFSAARSMWDGELETLLLWLDDICASSNEGEGEGLSRIRSYSKT